MVSVLPTRMRIYSTDRCLLTTRAGLGTIACSLSPSMGWLIAARAVAGAGGAGLLTVSSVITTDLTSLRSRGHYQGKRGIVPLRDHMSSFVSQRLNDDSIRHWSLFGRACLWLDSRRCQLAMVIHVPGKRIDGKAKSYRSLTSIRKLPFLLLSMIIVCIYLPSSPPHSHGNYDKPSRPTLRRALADFDFLGTVTLLVAISSLLLGLSNHTAFLYEWRDSRVWALLFTSLITTIVFLLVEWKVAVNPVVPLQLFKGSRMSSIYASNFMLSVAAQSFVSDSDHSGVAN
jgi:hypothetical protein